jgi:hypothetical protein
MLVLTEGADAVRMASPAEALAQFRASVSGTTSPVEELIAERRQAGAAGQ